jgi:hypothetical protein
MSTDRIFTNATGAPVVDNTNIQTAGPRGPALLQDICLIEKLANFDREVIPERRMHAKGWGAHGTFTVTADITRHTRARIFSEIGKKTPAFARFSTVAGEKHNPCAGAVLADHRLDLAAWPGAAAASSTESEKFRRFANDLDLLIWRFGSTASGGGHGDRGAIGRCK